MVIWGQCGRKVGELVCASACDLEKSRWGNRQRRQSNPWKLLRGIAFIGNICKSLFERIVLCRGWEASSTDHTTSGSEGSRHLSGFLDVSDCSLSHCTRNKMNYFMRWRTGHLPAPPQIKTDTSPDIWKRSRETWNCIPCCNMTSVCQKKARWSEDSFISKVLTVLNSFWTTSSNQNELWNSIIQIGGKLCTKWKIHI